MAKKKLIKAGDRTIVVNAYGEMTEFQNRIPSGEAAFALDLIARWGMVAQHNKSGPVLPAGAVVERAFDIAKVAFQHIKDNRMDVPFPFAKVYPNDKEND